MDAWIKVFAPATIGNIGPGFDILGVAINEPGDIVQARKVFEHNDVVIKNIVNDGGILPYETNKNTAGIAAQEVLRRARCSFGLELIIEKHMPIGSGLGSSSASAAAGAFAANILAGKPFSNEELVEMAGIAEHTVTGNYGEQCIAALLGGFVVTTSFQPLQGRNLGTLPDLWIVLAYPHFYLETKKAREVLPTDVPLRKAVDNNRHTSAMITAIVNNDHDLFLSHVDDVIIEPARQHLIPGFYDVKEAAIQAGANCATLSGAGPSLFAMTTKKEITARIAQAMKTAFQKHGLESTTYISPVNTKGTHLLEEEE